MDIIERVKLVAFLLAKNKRLMPKFEEDCRRKIVLILLDLINVCSEEQKSSHDQL